MSTSRSRPDYDLEPKQIVTDPVQVRAIFHPLRGTLLELLLERAASVQELAAAAGRPKASVAYHVKVLSEAGVLKVVRTRMVRGREESLWGRTARLFAVGDVRLEDPGASPTLFETAAREAIPALRDDDVRGLIRYAWIDESLAESFWDRVMDLVREYSELDATVPGTRAFALMTAMYPTEHPRLPRRREPDAPGPDEPA